MKILSLSPSVTTKTIVESKDFGLVQMICRKTSH